MANTLNEAIKLLKQLSEKGVEKALEALREIKSECDCEKNPNLPECPECAGGNIVRNGHKRKKQAYLCRSCGKSFVETTGTMLYNSHSNEATWKQIVEDTVNGVPIAETAENLGLHHETVFNMRHKILFCIEEEEIYDPTKLEGICEADETYILENYKGKKLQPDFWREPRKHGAKAKKPGLSNEYICVCAGVERDGDAISLAVNRSVASKNDINKVFGERVNENTLVVTDGAKGYDVLVETGKCMVLNVDEGGHKLYNINTVNNFHSFIKARNRDARGFATKYLNRYNALFSKIYRVSKTVTDDIFQLLCRNEGQNRTIEETLSQNLLLI
jgi:transposase-like protein